MCILLGVAIKSFFCFCDCSSEADLEDFISHLFHQAMNTDGSNSSNPQSWQPPQSNGQSWNNPSHTSTAPAAKRNRKKKRKH